MGMALARTDIVVAAKFEQRDRCVLCHHRPQRTEVPAPGTPAEEEGRDHGARKDREEQNSRGVRIVEHLEDVFGLDDDDQTADSDPDAVLGQHVRHRREFFPNPAGILPDNRQRAIGAPTPAGEENGNNQEGLPDAPNDEICRIILSRSGEGVDDQEKDKGNGDETEPRRDQWVVEQFPQKTDLQEIEFPRGRERRDSQEDLALGNGASFGDDNCSFNHLAQFVDIERPVMVYEKIQSFLGEAGNLFGEFLIILIEEVFRDDRDVLFPFP